MNKERNFIFFLSIIYLTGILFGSFYYFLCNAVLAALSIFIPMTVISPFIYFCWRKKRASLAANILLGGMLVVLLGISISIGRIPNPASWWLTTVPIVATLLLSFRAALFWSISSFFVILVPLVLQHFGIVGWNEIAKDTSCFFFISETSLIGLCLFLFALTYIFEKYRLKTEQELLLAHQKLVQTSRNSLIESISSGLAHEINNPLTVIIGRLHMLALRDFSEDETKKQIQVIHKSAERIGQIVKKLRALNLKGKLLNEEGRQDCSLASLSLQLEQVHRTAAQANGFNFTIENRVTEDSVPFPQNHLFSILNHLIANALEHGTSVTGKKWIKVTFNQSSNLLCIRVLNSGTPLSLEEQQRAFSPLYSTKPPSAEQNVGIGLNMACALTETLGGSLSFSHRKEDEVCLELLLPFIV